MVQNVEHNGQLLAVIIRAEYKKQNYAWLKTELPKQDTWNTLFIARKE